MIRKIFNMLMGVDPSPTPEDKRQTSPGDPNRRFEVGDTIAGDFKILKVFEGGMGYVILTQDPHEQFPFVLKTYKQNLGEIASKMFVKEAMSWVQIGLHPNILQAYWVRKLDSKMFVAAQYIPKDDNGHNTLSDYIRGRALSDKMLFSLVAQFCYGMTHAHNAGVKAHLDIKPDNILVCEGVLKISDFGLAKARESMTPPVDQDASRDGTGYSVWVTQKGAISGTPPYMAPEQFLGGEYTDSRSDIYSFGITLWEALAGRVPFVGQSILDYATKHRDEAAPELRHSLWPLIAKCLAKKPSDRYQTFSALLGDLQRIATSLSIQLPREPSDVDPEMQGLYAKAQSWMALGFPEKAIVAIEEYTRARPNDDCGWIEKGKILLQQGDAHGALEACRRGLTIFETSTAAWNNAGIALSRLGRHDEALAYFDKAVEIEPKNTGAMLNKARPLFALGRLVEAVDVLADATRIAPRKPAIWNNLGNAYHMLGNKQDAARCYRQAIELDPGLEEAKINLRALRTDERDPAVLMKEGKVSDAKMALLEQTRRLDRAVDWHNLGLIYMDEGHKTEALGCFERVTQLSPGDDFAYKRIIDLRGYSSDMTASIATCDRWIRFGSDKITAICLKAQMLEYAGKHEAAIAMLVHYSNKTRSNENLLFQLSAIQERAGQLSDALGVAERILDMFGDQRGQQSASRDLIEETIARLRKKVASHER